MRYLLAGVILLGACSQTLEPVTSAGTTPPATPATTALPSTEDSHPPAPPIPDGPIDGAADVAVDRLLTGLFSTSWDMSAVEQLVDAGDPRTAWLIADLLRFYQSGPAMETLTRAFSELTGANHKPGEVEFVWATNNLMAWDMPAWNGYAEAKRAVFGPLEPTWDRFFDEDHGIDWRLVTWGGVAPDQRPLDDNGECRCIPSLDHPETTDASEGDWYEDRRIVFGIVVEDEAIALPRHQMEVHEMVNLTLGGRELGIPYCTLCGSAQAYFVDDVAGVEERLVLRTSGLLSRSNKLMYDLTTGSAIDTFTGRALSGPLAGGGVVLEQVTVVASRWGEWKEAHPHTRILAEDGGIGRTYVDDPLGGRDVAGPIFPVGEIDSRLAASEPVVGVIRRDGTPVAFPVQATRAALAESPIQFEGLTVRLEDAIRVYEADGEELVSHQAFWFAWSQFHEKTLLWEPEKP